MTNRVHPPVTTEAVVAKLSEAALATTATSDDPLAPVAALAPMPDKPEMMPVDIDKDQTIYALYMAGHTPYAIARQLTVDEKTKWTSAMVQEVVSRVGQDNLARTQEQLVYAAQLDLDRIDALIQVLWPQAKDGNLAAIDRISALTKRRAELLGLDAPDVKLSLTMGGPDAVDLSALSDDELRQYRDLQRKASSAARQKVVKGRVV
jgi:hypothetical protein